MSTSPSAPPAVIDTESAPASINCQPRKEKARLGCKGQSGDPFASYSIFLQDPLRTDVTPMARVHPEPDEELVKAIPRITPDHLAQRMGNDPEKAEIALIDVRRADLTGHMLAGSVNLPAHTFYPSRRYITDLFKGKEMVVLYCASSRGRGPRCAGWMQETLRESDSKAKVVILDGGAKAFVESFGHVDHLLQRLPDEVKE